jgi:asparagine synthase (glutamine-hydrolysing)
VSAFALVAADEPQRIHDAAKLMACVADRGDVTGSLMLLENVAAAWSEVADRPGPVVVDRQDVALVCLGWVAAAPGRGWEDAARRIARGDLHAAHSLRGAWTLLVADRTNGAVWVVVDPMGLGVVHMHHAPGRLIVATEAAQVLSAGGVSSELNWGVLAERLATRPTTIGETPHVGVTHLQPGHALRWSRDGGLSEKTWWSWEDHLHRGVDEERVRAALATAVQRCRPVSSGGLGLLLSGGIDSSVLAGVATHCGMPPRALLLRYPGYPCDETAHQDAVVQHHGLAALAGPLLPFDPIEHVIEPTRRFRQPMYCPNTNGLPLLRAATQQGVNTVMTGLGGDEIFLAWPPRLADLAASGDFRRAGRLGRERVGQAGWRAAIRLSLAEAWADVLPRRLVSRRRRRAATWTVVADAFAHNIDLATRCTPPPLGIGQRARRRDRMRELIGTGWVYIDRVLGDREQVQTGVEYRWPYRDLDLIAATLGLVDEQRGHDGDNRSFQRRLYPELLPDAVRTRRGKATFDDPLADQLLHPWIRELLADPFLARHGIIDQQRLADRYLFMEAQVQRGPITTGGTTQLWTVVGIEVLARLHYGHSLPSL